MSSQMIEYNRQQFFYCTFRENRCPYYSWFLKASLMLIR